MNKTPIKEKYENYVREAYAECPTPSEKWKNANESSRKKMVQSVMELEENSIMKVMHCNDKGYVYIELLQPLEASKRGIMLLEFEFKLKEKLDQALTIWHSPQGDKSSLRRLRGVEVKS
jgi:hypothetical protein